MRNVVFSNGLNAWSLQKGLGKLGLSLYVCGEEFGLLRNRVASAALGDRLFFTEERSLGRFVRKAGYRYYPRQLGWFRDDKMEVARLLEEIGERPVPYWMIEESVPGYPVYVKARHSWWENRKLPRGFICQDKSDLPRIFSHIRDQGLQREWFFFQQLIAGEGDCCYSVAGFYDQENPARTRMLVTRKVVGDGKIINTGIIVETVTDPERLLSRTNTILASLEYKGPFELEFLFHEEAGQWYVLELNPRFWLQHGIFIDACDNWVIERYLDLDCDPRRGARSQDVGHPAVPVVWVDVIGLILESMRGRTEPARSFLEKRSRARRYEATLCMYPDWRTALAYVVRWMRNRLRK